MIDILTLAYKDAALFTLKDASGADILEAAVACKYKVKGPTSRKHQDAWGVYQLECSSPSKHNASYARAKFLTAITERMDVGYGELQGDDALMAMYSDPKTQFVAEQVFVTARKLDNFKP